MERITCDVCCNQYHEDEGEIIEDPFKSGYFICKACFEEYHPELVWPGKEKK